MKVSIPRSGFCVFGLSTYVLSLMSTGCFNPSVGILCFRTSAGHCLPAPQPRFQSLGRDSVFSDSMDHQYPPAKILGFQSLGRDSVFSDSASTSSSMDMATFQSLGRDSVFSDYATTDAAGAAGLVSIPRSGFCVFGLY